MRAIWLVATRFSAPTGLVAAMLSLPRLGRGTVLVAPLRAHGGAAWICSYRLEKAREGHEYPGMEYQTGATVYGNACRWHVGKHECVVEHDDKHQHKQDW